MVTRSNPTRREGGRLVTTEGPSVNTRMSPGAVGQYRAPRIGNTGLESVTQAFSGFFNQVGSALGNLTEAERMKQQADIESANRRYEVQGTQDALLGRPMDQEAGTFGAYADAYQKVVGIETGQRMVSDWTEQVYLNAAPGDDLEAQTEEWLRSEFGTGTDSEIANINALSTFKQGTDDLVQRHRENTVRAQLSQGINRHTANVVSSIRTRDFNAEDITGWIEDYRSLDPMNPTEAPIRMAQAIISSVQGQPRSVAQRALSELHKPGTGLDGRSFMESWPEAGNEIDRAMTQNFMSGLSVAGYESLQALEEQSRSLTPDTLPDFMAGLAQHRERHSDRGLDTLMNRAGSVINEFATNEAGTNRYGAMLRGEIPMSPEDAEDFQLAYLERSGIADPFANIETAVQSANLIAPTRTIDKNLKGRLNAALTNFDDPNRQATALSFLMSVSDISGDDDLVYDFIDTDTAYIYDYVKRQSPTGIVNPTAIENLRAQRESVRSSRDVQWMDITGSADNREATESVRGTVQDAVDTYFQRGGWFGRQFGLNQGSSATIPQTIYRRMIDNAKVDVVRMGQLGVDDWEQVVSDSVSRQMRGYNVLPGMDGQWVLNDRPINRTDPLTGRQSVELGVAVRHPELDIVENTSETARRDLNVLPERLPGIIGSSDNIALRTSDESDYGYEVVVNMGGTVVPMKLGRGQDYTFGDETVAFSEDLGEMRQQLQEMFPEDWWVFVPDNDEMPTGYTLQYRPHFTGRSVEEMAAGFDAQQDTRFDPWVVWGGPVPGHIGPWFPGADEEVNDRIRERAEEIRQEGRGPLETDDWNLNFERMRGQ